jgi:hypothetical protein
MLGVLLLRNESRRPRRACGQQDQGERGAMRRAVTAGRHGLSRVRDCGVIVGPLTCPTSFVGEASAPSNVTVRSPRFIVNVTEVADAVPVSDVMSL